MDHFSCFLRYCAKVLKYTVKLNIYFFSMSMSLSSHKNSVVNTVSINMVKTGPNILTKILIKWCTIIAPLKAPLTM